MNFFARRLVLALLDETESLTSGRSTGKHSTLAPRCLKKLRYLELKIIFLSNRIYSRLLSASSNPRHFEQFFVIV